MMVRAVRLGYYEHLRRYPADSGHKRSGEPFELKSEKHFSKKWMEALDSSEAKKPEKKAEARVASSKKASDREVL